MRAFVAGGAGFIGSHAVDRLLGMPAVEKVTVFDNFSSGQGKFLPSSANDARLNIIRDNISDLPALAAAMCGHDVVFHFASNPDISQAVTNPMIDFWQGALLTQNIVEAMRRAGVPQILYASGSGIYGDCKDKRLLEDFAPLLPVSTYGASKLAGESIICAYCHMFGLQAWVFRFGNVVGPRQTHGVLLDFIRRLKSDPEKLSILGDGNQSKPYIHVEDVLNGVWLAWQKASDRYNYFNLATDDAATVKEIAGIAVHALGLSGARYQYSGGDRGWQGDVPVVRLDSSKIKRLGWNGERNSPQALAAAAKALVEEVNQDISRPIEPAARVESK